MGVKAGGLEGLFVPGDRNWGGAGPPDQRSLGACDTGNIPSLTFQPLWTAALSNVGERGSRAQRQHRGPQRLLPASRCGLWARLPRPPILLGDHFTRGLSSSPQAQVRPRPLNLGWDGDTHTEGRGDKAWGIAACPVHTVSLPSSSSTVISFKKRSWKKDGQEPALVKMGGNQSPPPC